MKGEKISFLGPEFRTQRVCVFPSVTEHNIGTKIEPGVRCPDLGVDDATRCGRERRRLLHVKAGGTLPSA